MRAARSASRRRLTLGVFPWRFWVRSAHALPTPGEHGKVRREQRTTDMPQPTIYHNPRCSKSRATLDLLTARGFEPRVMLYLETPPNAAEIEALLRKLDAEPRAILRSDEDEYAALGLADPAKTRSELIAAIAAHPRLLQRPIVVHGAKAAIGRPPEAVLGILSD